MGSKILIMRRITYFWRLVEIFIIIPFITILLCNIGNRFINFIGKNSDLYAIYFDYNLNKDTLKNIVIINIEDDSRENILKTLIEVKNSNPQVIGLDYIFKMEEDKVIDSMLIQEIVQGQKTILPYDIKNNEGSYFTSEYNIKYGFANPYHNIYIRDYKLFEKNDNDWIPSFGGLLSGQKNVPLCNRKFTIDFSGYINTIHSDYIKENSNVLKDKIVLIGNKYNPNDFHQTPIGIKSGIEIQSYIINTILKNRNIPYKNIVILLCVLTFIYFGFIYLVYKIHHSSKRFLIAFYSWIITFIVIFFTGIIFYLFININVNNIIEYALLFPISLSLSISFYISVIKFCNCQISLFSDKNNN